MGFIGDIINGIKNMIKTFKQIICFLSTVPTRIENINAGFGNIFKGINTEFEAIGKSFKMGTESVGTLSVYIGELINTYVGCGFQFFENFFECIFYYLVDITLYILYLPILLILWLFKSLLGLDFSYIVTRTYNGLQELNDFLYPIIGFQIIHWPSQVRKDCYLCKRLKVSAVEKKAVNVGTTFKTKIPQNFGKSRAMFSKGRKQFNEIFKANVRKPADVN
jgi:hypothetical protein